MSLAWDWLELQLAAAGLGAPESFFGPVTPLPKVSRAVLPVFFRQVDACLVTRRGYEMMGEMNPQVLTKLRVLAASPKLIPVVVGVRRNLRPEQKEAFRAAMVGLSQTVRGRHILAVFGGMSLGGAGESLMGPSIELMNAARAVRARRR